MPAIFHKLPHLRFLIPLISGILLEHFTNSQLLQITFFVLFILFIILSIIYSYIRSYSKRWVFGVAIFLFFVVAGSVAYSSQEKKSSWDVPPSENTYICQLTNIPVEKEKTFLCHVKLTSLIDNGKNKDINKNIIAYIRKDSLSEKLSVGDRIFIRATINPPRNNGNPGEFDYASYLKRQGICGITFLKSSDWKFTKEQNQIGIKQQALLCREKLLSIYETLNLQPNEKSILAALTLGYKHDLSPELRNSFSVTGAGHVLAVSGLHVGIIYMITNFLLLPVGRYSKKIKIVKYILLILFLWGFAFITGLSPSVVRAVSMFSLSSIAIVVNRKASIFNTICVAAFIMLLYNPFYLFDVGFQLSYSAVIAIVLLQSRLQRILLLKNRFLKAIWSLITVSVAAQMGTLPLVVYYFNQFPNYFILTNLLVIPLTYLIIAFAILALVFHTIFGDCWIVRDLLEWLLKLMNQGVFHIETMPFSSIQHIHINEFEVLLLFLLMISGCVFLLKKRFFLLTTALGCLLSLIVIHTIRTHQFESQSYIAFYHQKTAPVVQIISGCNNYIATNDSVFSARNKWLKNNSNEPILLTFPFFYEDLFFCDSFISFKNKKIYMLTDNELTNRSSKSPLNIDYLLIGNKFSGKLNQVLALFNPREIILDASLPAYTSKRLQKECEEHSMLYHDIAEQGALQIFCK